MLKTKIKNLKNNSNRLPIVFLHGWGGDENSFDSCYNYFAEFWPVLSVKFEISKTKVQCVQTFAAKLIKTLQSLNISSCYLVAHSFGGRIALIVSSQTDLVKAQVLTGCAGLRPRFNLKKYLKILKYKALVKRGKEFDKSKYGSQDYNKLSNIQKQTFKNIVNTDLKFCLSSVNCPTMLIFGKKDKDTPIYMAKTLNKKINMCKIKLYDNCNHFAYLQKPRQFNSDTENFLLVENEHQGGLWK